VVHDRVAVAERGGVAPELLEERCEALGRSGLGGGPRGRARRGRVHDRQVRLVDERLVAACGVEAGRADEDGQRLRLAAAAVQSLDERAEVGDPARVEDHVQPVDRLRGECGDAEVGHDGPEDLGCGSGLDGCRR
jgi:hypothetical protein